jgi:hypothetical protein
MKQINEADGHFFRLPKNIYVETSHIIFIW